MRLWLLRHAPVQAEPGLCYGRSDLPAQPDETQAAARRAIAQLPKGLALRHSPLSRCAVLAAELHALRPEMQPHHDARIAEMDFGAWEGRPWSQIERSEFEAWKCDFGGTRVGGSGESVRQFMARVADAYDDWRASGDDALWVTHAGVIRVVWLLSRGVRAVTRADQWPKDPVAFGELMSIDFES